jgi:hypothetical protein
MWYERRPYPPRIMCPMMQTCKSCGRCGTAPDPASARSAGSGSTLLQQPPQHRLQPVKLRTDRRPPIARWLVAREQTRDRPPIDPEPTRDLPLRDPIRRQRPHLCPLQRAPHLRTSAPLARQHRPNEPRRRGGRDQLRPRVVHFSITDPGAVLGCAHQRVCACFAWASFVRWIRWNPLVSGPHWPADWPAAAPRGSRVRGVRVLSGVLAAGVRASYGSIPGMGSTGTAAATRVSRVRAARVLPGVLAAGIRGGKEGGPPERAAR